MEKKRWRNRKGAGLLALTLAFALALSGLGMLDSRAALAVEVDKQDCTLKVDADSLYSLIDGTYGPGTPEADENDLSNMQENVTVNLYKVASMDAGGNYTPVAAFANADLGLDEINHETDANAWLEKAAEAAAVVKDGENGWKKDQALSFVAQLSTSEGQTSVTFRGLSVGLYLVAAEQVVTDCYIYDFAPYLVSVPNNMYYVTGDDTWMYNVEMGLKVEQSERYGNLKINKNLTKWNGMPGDQATFVYKLDIETLKGEREQRIEAITIDGKLSGTAEVTHIPAGSKVTVTEIYSGAGYDQTAGPDSNPVTIVANGTYVSENETVTTATVSFENAPDGTATGGYGVRNNFRLDENGQWQFQKPNA